MGCSSNKKILKLAFWGWFEDDADVTEAAMCAMWAAGYLHGINFSRQIAKETDQPDPLTHICVPPVFKISAGRLMSIVVQHGFDSPSDLDQDIESFAARALLGAFPCPD